jgi:hypothetical protein
MNQLVKETRLDHHQAGLIRGISKGIKIDYFACLNSKLAGRQRTALILCFLRVQSMRNNVSSYENLCAVAGEVMHTISLGFRLKFPSKFGKAPIFIALPKRR